MRESPALDVLELLHRRGAESQLHRPVRADARSRRSEPEVDCRGRGRRHRLRRHLHQPRAVRLRRDAGRFPLIVDTRNALKGDNAANIPAVTLAVKGGYDRYAAKGRPSPTLAAGPLRAGALALSSGSVSDEYDQFTPRQKRRRCWRRTRPRDVLRYAGRPARMGEPGGPAEGTPATSTASGAARPASSTPRIGARAGRPTQSDPPARDQSARRATGRRPRRPAAVPPKGRSARSTSRPRLAVLAAPPRRAWRDRLFRWLLAALRLPAPAGGTASSGTDRTGLGGRRRSRRGDPADRPRTAPRPGAGGPAADGGERARRPGRECADRVAAPQYH